MSTGFDSSPSSTVTSETTYDELDRPLTVKDADNTVSTLSYDISDAALHTVTTIPQNASTNIVKESYTDLDKQVVKQKDNGKTTTFDFDAAGQLLSVLDEDGNTTSSEYDLAGRRTQWIHPDAGTNTYTYDNLGQLMTMVTPNLAMNSDEIIYKSDALGRIKSVTYPDYANSTPNINNVKYEYYPATTGGIDNNRGRLMLVQDATGLRKYEYGSQGEIVKDIRTIIAPGQDNKTYVHRFHYDTWNRIDTLIYPNKDTLLYKYDLGGNLNFMKAGVQVYIDSIGYDEFEQKVFCKYGNSTSQTYTYSPTLRRLSNLVSKDHSGTSMYNLSYTFDKIGNVDSIHNSAGIINEMGGSYYHKYTYDNFNRISTAHGSWTGDTSNTLGNKASNYTLAMAYENMHRITTKQQGHIRDGANVGENTYENLFKYEDVNHPNTVTSIENQTTSEVEEFNYDANGNVLLHEFDNGDTKNMLWDEANMLKAIKISNATSFQHNIYDAKGERTLKGLGNYAVVNLNGQSQTNATVGNYAQYVSGYMVMGPHYMVTNHYYSGTERIACKLVGSVDSSVDNSLELSGSEKAGLPDRQAEDLELVRTEYGFDTLIIEDTDPEEDDCEGNNDCPSVLYFFHPDHIGSSTYLTDEAGNPYQFLLYLPFGESMAEQKAGGYSTKYRFTGKEVDEETGLYYFGARYYDPRISLWYGVDPMTEKNSNFNPFAYTANNPIKFIDPDGRDYYEGEDGKIQWFNSTEKSYIFDKKTYKNIGESYASFDGNYLKYHYQNKDKDGNLSPNMQSFAAVSGRPDANGNFDYSKQNQMNPSTGPIPEGSYTMNMTEAPVMTTYKNLEGTIGGLLGQLGLGKHGTFPGGRSAWGDGRIDINPDNVFVKMSNSPFDLGVYRGGFTIHGGSTPGSAGCIDLCSGFGEFKSMVEQFKGNTNDIKLKVKYNMVRPVPSRFR